MGDGLELDDIWKVPSSPNNSGISMPHTLERASLCSWLLLPCMTPAFVVTKLEHSLKHNLFFTCCYKPDDLKLHELSTRGLKPIACCSESKPFWKRLSWEQIFADNSWEPKFRHILSSAAIFWLLAPLQKNCWVKRLWKCGRASRRVPPEAARGQGPGLLLPRMSDAATDFRFRGSEEIHGHCS